jgi:transketolase
MSSASVYNLAKSYLDIEQVEWKKMRDGIGQGMAELGEKKKDVVVLGADTMESSRAHFFAEKFPERTIQVGVAEQNLIGVGAGLAYNGKVPYMVTYAAFLLGRPWEPIRTMFAYPNNHGVFIASHTGLATGEDGPTHQMTEDISIMRCLPNFTLLCPADYEQGRKAAIAAYDLKGPVYIRGVRAGTPNFTTDKTPFEVGKAQILREGKDVTVIGHGYMVYWLLQIAEDLQHEFSIEVINLHTIKPIDKETIVNSAKKTKRVFCAEDHNVIGGMGGAVAELLGEHYPVPMKIHGVYDQFAESGSVEDLWKKYKLDKLGVQHELRSFLKK